MIPPTTGTTPEIAVFARRTRTLSTVPAKIPLTVRYSVNASSSPVSSLVQIVLMATATANSRRSPKLLPAASVPTNRYTKGISNPQISSSSRSAKKTVATCRTVAPAAPPATAEAAAKAGSSAFEKVLICSITAVPAPISVSNWPMVKSVTVKTPAMERKRLVSPVPFWTPPTSPHSTVANSTEAAPRS